MIPDSCIIFTDGSSRGNPGPGGFGAVIVMQDRVMELGGREEYTTNNRMELVAAIKALSFLSTINSELPTCVYSDSSYLINGITKWIHTWKKKGWITSAKESVENRDLWEELDNLTAVKSVDWKYVGGHIGVAGNERCDEIATAFADGVKPALYNGHISNYPIKNLLEVSQDISKKNSKSESRSRAGKKAYSYLSIIGGRIEIHKTWAECERRVKGVSGARFKKTLNAEDEEAIIKEWKSPA